MLYEGYTDLMTNQEKLSVWCPGTRVYFVIDDDGAPDHGCQSYGTVVDTQQGWASGQPSAKVCWDDTKQTLWTNLDRVEQVA